MKKESLKKLFTDAASDVADQFYPKGKSDRRGEFIRDCGVLWVRLQDSVDKYVKSKKKKPIALETIVIVDAILGHFVEDKEGVYSDEAYFELVDMVEALLLGELKKKDFVQHLEFIFGFDGLKEYTKVEQGAMKTFKYYRRTGHLPVINEEGENDVSRVE